MRGAPLSAPLEVTRSTHTGRARLVGRLPAHVDGVDLQRIDRYDDPAVACAVVRSEVGTVLRADLVRECVIGVRLDLRASARLKVPVGVLQVEEEQAALRP